MTESTGAGHLLGVMAAALALDPEPRHAVAAAAAVDHTAFAALYDAHVGFVWRNLRRMGVPEANLDDATQDVFLVLHRRLADLPADGARGWIFGIARRVAADHRRLGKRRGTVALDPAREPTHVGSTDIERSEAARLVHAALAELSAEQREVLVLIDLEQLPAPEASAALGVGLNTVYSRLRLARAAFERHVMRLSRPRVTRGTTP